MRSKLFLAALVLVLMPAAASADTIINFATQVNGGVSGNLFVTTVTVNGVTVTGWEDPDGATGGYFWVAANLYLRNQTGDHGLGVCSSAESVGGGGAFPNCDPSTSNGDVNELDNSGAQEVILITKPAGMQWVSVQLSSLDNNSGGGAPVEEGYLVGTNCTDPNDQQSGAACSIGSAFAFITFSGSGSNSEPIFLIPDAFKNFSTIWFVPFDLNGTNTNNDFLVYQVTIAAPEPGTLALLGLGLAGLAAIRRRMAA